MGLRGLVLLQDGVGDRPLEELGDRTPLQAAHTPNLDLCAERGICGLVDMVAPGVPVGTDVGHLVLFDQDLSDGPYRRGPLEAAGLGMILRSNEIAFRVNFATADQDGFVIDRRASRIRDGTDALARSLSTMRLDGDVEVEFHAATEHRGVLVLRGEGLSPEVSDSDPGHDAEGRRVLEVAPLQDDDAARRTAQYLNQIVAKSRKILQDHPVSLERVRQGRPPVNIILTRAGGGPRSYLNLSQQLGLRIACVSAECTVLGIARLAGITPIQTPQMTANLDTDLGSKAMAALDALRDNDLVFVHVKGADIAGHDGKPELKRWFIQRSDRMLGNILNSPRCPSRLLVALASDHATLSRTGKHGEDPVPVCVSGPGIVPDDCKRFDEASCAKGGLGRILGRDFLKYFLDRLAGRERPASP